MELAKHLRRFLVGLTFWGIIAVCFIGLYGLITLLEQHKLTAFWVLVVVGSILVIYKTGTSIENDKKEEDY